MFLTPPKTYEKLVRTRKKLFFGFFRPAPAKILHIGLQKVKNVWNGPFSRVFSMNCVFFRCSQAVSEKNGRLKKKIHKFYRVQSKVMTIFLSSFWKKKIWKKILSSKKKFFWKLLFHFWTWREKKVFFFEKKFQRIFRPDFFGQVFLPGQVFKRKK